MIKSKQDYIHQLFNKISAKYDLLNSIISFGQDKNWRRFTAIKIKEHNPSKILDVCAGTGMMSLALAREIKECQITGIDFSEGMLEKGASNLRKYREKERIELRWGNASELDFPDNSFDCAVMAFSLRNVDSIPEVLQEMKRIVKKGGLVVNLDISKPDNSFFRQLFYLYFYQLVPLVGRVVSGKEGPYKYLPNSLTNFPERKQLEEIFTEIGLSQVRSYPLTGGVAALHLGKKV